MRRTTILLASIVVLTTGATAVRAQPRITASYGNLNKVKYNTLRHRDNRDSDGKKRRKELLLNRLNDLNKKNAALDEHVDRMKRDHLSRGMTKPYIPGWIREKDGLRIDDIYNRKVGDRNAAKRAADTARALYDAEP